MVYNFAATNHSRNENILQLFIDQTPTAIALLDREMRYLLVSRKWLTLTSLGEQDILGRSHYDVFPNTPDACKAVHQTCLTDAVAVCVEDSLQQADGTTLWIKSEIQPWYDSTNAVAGLILFQEDITHQKQSVEVLQQNQQLLNSIIDHTNACIFVKEYRHTNGQYLLANQQFSQRFNLDRQTVQTKTDHDIFSPEIAEAFREVDRQVLKSGTALQVEEVASQADAHTFVVTKFPLFDRRGEPYAVCGIATDVNEQLAATLRERKQKDLKLQKTKEVLEVRIEERTVELEHTIEQLREEILERQAVLKERAIAEEKLRSSEAELQALFSAMTDVVIVLDAQGKYLKIVPTNAPPSYKPTQTLIGKTFHDFLPKAQADQFLGYLQQTLKTKQTVHFEYSLLVDDRSPESPQSTRTLWFDGSVSALTDSEVIWIERDITDRKQVEQDLREQAHLSSLRAEIDFSLTQTTTLQQMLQRCTEVVVQHLDAAFARIWTLNTSEDILELQASAGIYTHLNGAHGRVPVGQFKIGLIAKERQPHLTNAVLEDPRVSDKEWAKREGMVAFAGYPLMVEGQLLGVIALFDRKCLNDKTIKALETIASELSLGIKRKQAEAALQESEAQLRQQTHDLEAMLQELQQTQSQLVQTEKMSSLGQLVAGVAHEINNPVNFIFGNVAHASEYTQDLLQFVQLYQKHYPNPVAEIQKQAAAIDLHFLMQDLPKTLSSMKVGAQRIQKIVLALRNFSRMDEAEVKEVSLHDGIDSTLMILHSRLKETATRNEIEVVREYGNLPLVECYAGPLNQVFMNILANAIDAIDESFDSSSSSQLETAPRDSPTIYIRTQVTANQSVQICIGDNGAGVSEGIRKRLFEPFFTTKPVGKGTGLGLSISYQIVTEKHGGTLNCISTLGQGTEFLIEIPLFRSLAESA